MFQEPGPYRPEADASSRPPSGADEASGGNRHRRTRGNQGPRASSPAPQAPRPATPPAPAPRQHAVPGRARDAAPRKGPKEHGKGQKHPPQPQASQANRQPRHAPQPQGQAGYGPASGNNNRNQHQNQNNRNRRVRPAGREAVEIRHRPDRYDEEAFERNAETWWADSWLHTVNRFWKGRVASGRLYAADKRVLSFGVESGRIRAKVQGTRIEPYDVTISLKQFPDADWDLVADIMSCQALFTAQLLAGDMPQDVEEVFDAAGAPLLPRHKEDIQSRCSCPDPANPCKHIAAVFYVMAEAFDKDPFVIFHLRGRSRESLLTQLREKRAEEAQAMPMNVESLDAGSLEPLRFWQAGEELEAVTIMIAPAPAGTAKRLGRPPFWRSPADPITQLGQLYDAISRRARDVALTESLMEAAGKT